mmetsp:Transcript_9321/g.25300  ORF Transcript_9321/g.25300 Transcript_9321/m.25300 type:complete len:97 (-) Transcript_9321:1680-1970(-)
MICTPVCTACMTSFMMIPSSFRVTQPRHSSGRRRNPIHSSRLPSSARKTGGKRRSYGMDGSEDGSEDGSGPCLLHLVLLLYSRQSSNVEFYYANFR